MKDCRLPITLCAICSKVFCPPLQKGQKQWFAGLCAWLCRGGVPGTWQTRFMQCSASESSPVSPGRLPTKDGAAHSMSLGKLICRGAIGASFLGVGT